MIVHNFYRSSLPSGENLSVLEQVKGLERQGVATKLFARHSDDLAALDLARQATHVLDPFGTPAAVRDFARELTDFAPDVVHIENLWPMISPRIISVCRKAGVPVIASVRNYRLTCVAATHFRENHPCHQCTGRNTAPGIVHGCYQGSRLRSVPIAGSTALFHRSLRSLDRYLPVSEHVRTYLIANGVDDRRITVRPNAIPDPGPPPPPSPGALLYLGRLSEEKGLRDLLTAWASVETHDHVLRIAGDGDLRGAVEAAAAADPTIHYLGRLDGPPAAQAIRDSSCVVIPSRWAEPFGRVAIEAFANGRPAIAYRSGGLADVVAPGTGWLVNDIGELEVALGDFVRAEPEQLDRLSRAARARYLERYHPDVNLAILLDAYHELGR